MLFSCLFLQQTGTNSIRKPTNPEFLTIIIADSDMPSCSECSISPERKKVTRVVSSIQDVQSKMGRGST